MSEFKNYSVDDILEEIRRQKSAQTEHAASHSGVSRVDSLVEEIIKERKAAVMTQHQQDSSVLHSAPPEQKQTGWEPDPMPQSQDDVPPNTAEEKVQEYPPHHGAKPFTMREFLKESAESQLGTEYVPPDPPEQETPPEPEVFPEFAPELSSTPVNPEGELLNETPVKPERADWTVQFQPPVSTGADAVLEQTQSTPLGSEPDSDLFEYSCEADGPHIMAELVAIRRSVVLRIVFMALFCVASLVLAAGQELFPQLIPSIFLKSSQPVLYVSIQFGILSFSLMLCYSMIWEGLSAAFRFRPDRDSMAAIALLVSIVSTVACLFDQSSVSYASVHLYTPVITGMLLFYNCAKFSGLSRMIANFRTISSPYQKYVTHIIEDEGAAEELTRGAVKTVPITAVHKKVNFVADFIAFSTDEDVTDEYAKFLVPVGVGFALLLSIVSGYMTKNYFTALTTAAAVLCVFSPFAYLFTVQSPMSRVARKYGRFGSMLLSADACGDYGDINAVVVAASALFPGNSVSLFGIKTFAGQRIDEALIDAASVIHESGSILTGVFEQITGGDEKLLRPVDTILYEDGMGLSAWVDNRRVLIGNRELMINHGIGVPSRDYEERYLNDGNELVYLSTSGELTAVFLIKLFASPDVKDSVKRLYENGIRLVVKSVDAVVTRKMLSELFNEDESVYKILPSRLHALYNEAAASVMEGHSSVVSNGMFSSFAGSLIAARRMKLAVLLGAVLQFTAIGVGLILLLAMTLLSGMSEMKVTTLFLYEMLWLAATLLIPRLRTV